MKNSKVYQIENLIIDSDYLSFAVDGVHYQFRLSEVSPRLAKASEQERSDFRITASGYGIHWDSIDEDLSIKGLLQK